MLSKKGQNTENTTFLHEKMKVTRFEHANNGTVKTCHNTIYDDVYLYSNNFIWNDNVQYLSLS